MYDGNRHISIASLGADIFDRTVTINGMSKAFAMTGWRIGYAGAPSILASSIAAIQSQSTHHPANASQYAALACLEADGSFARDMRAHFSECRALALAKLARIPGLQTFEPQGAFYAFFNLEAYLGKSHDGQVLRTSMDICEYLLREHLLATVPGSSFGMEGHMRISFANSLPGLEAALDRLEKGLAALK